MIENFGDKINTNGFDKNPNNINKSGRPISFKRTYKEIHEDSDSVLWIDTEKILNRTIERENNKIEQIGITLSPVQNLLVRLDQLILSKNDRVAFSVIKFLWEQFDGKSMQKIEHREESVVRIGYGPDPEEEE